MSFLYYVAQTERTYCYRIKTIFEIDDTSMSIIERVLTKYEPKDISPISRTIYQATPLDFPEVRGGEVSIIDITLGLPASTAVLQDELFRALGIPSVMIRVFGDNDPMSRQQAEKEAHEDMEAEASKDALAPAALLALPDYEEAAPVEVADYCGPDYNSRFLAFLKQVTDERQERMKIDAPHPITRWADQPKDEEAEDYNAALADQPAKVSATKDGVEPGCGDETVVSVYTDGKKVTKIERKVTGRSKSA